MNNILEKVKRRKFFYRDLYRKSLYLLFICLIIILFLCTTIFYIRFIQKDSKFYATSNDGTIRALQPLDAPNNSPVPLID